MIFLQKCYLSDAPSIDKLSMSHLFSFSRYQKNVLLSSYLDNLCHEFCDLSSVILQSNGRQVEKEGRMEIQKYEYLENEKSSLDEIKSIFHSF